MGTKTYTHTLAAAEALARLQQELDWLRENTKPIEGETAAARESWANVTQELALLGATLQELGR